MLNQFQMAWINKKTNCQLLNVTWMLYEEGRCEFFDFCCNISMKKFCSSQKKRNYLSGALRNWLGMKAIKTFTMNYELFQCLVISCIQFRGREVSGKQHGARELLCLSEKEINYSKEVANACSHWVIPK